MTRNFVTILDTKNKVHVVNATDIIDIYDLHGLGYYTVKCMDSHFIDITVETYEILVPLLRPVIIPDLIAKAKEAKKFPKNLPESIADAKL